jgi:hypothetical protein
MENIEITKIEIDESGKLLVTPIINWNDFFQFIYRAATGVRWNENSKCFVAPVPKEWSQFDWYANIVTSVRSENGVNLKITPRTKWLNVPDSLKVKIMNYDKSIGT